MGAGKLGKDLAEDQSGKAGGDAFLVKPAFLDGSLVECARVGRPGKERLPPEDESKHLQPVTAIIFRGGRKGLRYGQGRSRRAARSISKNCSETDRAP